MGWDFKDLDATDDLATWANGLKTSLKSEINDFPGENLHADSVTTDKLAKDKARGAWTLGPVTMGATSRNNIMTKTVLNSDGAAATYKIVGWSLACCTDSGATALTKVAASSLDVRFNGASLFTIDLNAAALALGTPVSADISASPHSLSSAAGTPILTVNYTSGGAASYPLLTLVLEWTLTHAGT